MGERAQWNVQRKCVGLFFFLKIINIQTLTNMVNLPKFLWARGICIWCTSSAVWLLTASRLETDTILAEFLAVPVLSISTRRTAGTVSLHGSKKMVYVLLWSHVVKNLDFSSVVLLKSFRIPRICPANTCLAVAVWDKHLEIALCVQLHPWIV